MLWKIVCVCVCVCVCVLKCKLSEICTLTTVSWSHWAEASTIWLKMFIVFLHSINKALRAIPLCWNYCRSFSLNKFLKKWHAFKRFGKKSAANLTISEKMWYLLSHFSRLLKCKIQLMTSGEVTWRPVSYTHLDVYKRQVLETTSIE